LRTVEDPDRLVEEAAERDDRFDVLLAVVAEGLARAALHEGEVDVLLRVAQQHEVVARADAVPQLDLDLIALELLGVALAELGVGAVLRAGGEDHAMRRRGIEEPVGRHEQRDADDDERSPRDREIAHRDQRLADDARH